MKKIISILILSLSLIFSGCSPLECGEDLQCFESALKTCKNANVKTVFPEREIIYEIVGEVGERCKIKHTSKTESTLLNRECLTNKNSKLKVNETFQNLYLECN